ncbi:TadE/TadG family type IV pilus assembly protein [Allosalinactinospora lopnorensis]|uniref:TadE/TadG family type IV pilus assembly protein n=1 Tax=Allosalinactinospora lopnorensis TaxID=1352348 RepID=UPI000623CEE2|nr:TadE/TadG family type IV pilus assembly protein [Allosalinactinospora lopnorensis]
MTLPQSDRGSATLELAVLSLGLLMLISVVVALGRFQVTAHAVEDAARAAARQASIARSAQDAQANAHSAAVTTLAAQGLQCTEMTVSLDTSGFTKSPGDPAQVSATVHCSVLLSETALPGLPGSRDVTATFTSPIDTFRESAP